MRCFKKLIREIVGGELYEYYPLGKFIVSALGICGGRPTFKYTRVEVEVLLDLIAAGHPIHEMVKEFKGKIHRQAIREALKLASSLIKREAKAVAM